MKTYKQSVLEYADVRDAMACAREEAREEGILIGEKRGEKHGEEKVRIAILKNLYNLNMSTDQITKALGLTEKEIAELLQSNDFRD